jgi:hypothetical protein
MPKTVADYEDAVRRIANAEVDPDSTTLAEVRSDLHGAHTPQLTPEVADGVADAIVTEERVIDAIEATGELPTEAEIPAITSVADDYDLDDRVDAVVESVGKRVATVEDVESAVRERQDQRGTDPVFREHVETAVDSVAESGKQFVGESPNEVASEQAREIGAPSQSNFKRAAVQTVAQGEQMTASDALGEDVTERKGIGQSRAAQSFSVVRSERGERVGVVGSDAELGQEVADEVGAEFIRSAEVAESMDVEGSGESVDLTLRGQKVGEVDVE